MSDHSVPPDDGPAAAGQVFPPVDQRTVRLTWGRLLVLAAIILVAAVAAGLIGLPDSELLAADVAAIGPAAPAVFVLLYAVVTLVPLPKNVLTVVAGLLFGLVEGTGLALLGALLGAVAAFGLGRVLGRDAVERITGRRVARVDAVLSRHGFLAVLAVRLVPVLPFTAINYAAGLTAVRNRDYLIGPPSGSSPARSPTHLWAPTAHHRGHGPSRSPSLHSLRSPSAVRPPLTDTGAGVSRPPAGRDHPDGDVARGAIASLATPWCLLVASSRGRGSPGTPGVAAPMRAWLVPART